MNHEISGEWDCNDGSDEQRLFILKNFTEHNARLKNLTQIQAQCYERYRPDNTAFSDLCNISSEYPCFRTGVKDIFNFTVNRPCISLTQTGDGIVDCLSGLDERNILQCSNLADMLGFSFQFNETLCANYPHCDEPFPWKRNESVAYDSVCFYQEKHFRNGTKSHCDSVNDVMCLNDTCIKNARCNGRIECSHGEDEYRCPPPGDSTLKYRLSKIFSRIITLYLQKYPASLPKTIQTISSNTAKKTQQTVPNNHLPIVYEKRNSTKKTVYEIVRDSLPKDEITFEEHYLPFVCNHGLAMKYHTGHTVCFCPLSSYGSQCEYFSDRITILTHLDLTNYRFLFDQISMIKILVTFLFDNRIIDYDQFHVNPSLEKENPYFIKQWIYFTYLRTKEFIQMKKTHRNGTQLYSVQFEAFNLYVNGRIQPVGVWKYPIYFDFLPSFRLAKVLRFPSSSSSYSISDCANNPCQNNGTCMDIINSNHSSYYCSCRSGYYGDHCQSFDNQQCHNHCSPSSICKLEYHSLITGNQYPLCICSASTFGNTCSIKNNRCQSNPCLNEGTCYVTYDFRNVNDYLCHCTDTFKGNRCQYPNSMVDISIVLSSNSTVQTTEIIAVTISHNYYFLRTLTLDHRYQQVYKALPSRSTLIYTQKLTTTAPTIAYMKIYYRNYQHKELEYYLLYYLSDQKGINITIDLTSENHCPLVQTLWHLLPMINFSSKSHLTLPDIKHQKALSLDHSVSVEFNSTTAVFFYHQICQAKRHQNLTLTCFRDMNYLCLCQQDHYRAECFGYNHSIDHCFLCLSNGYCLESKSDNRRDFLCVCPRCYSGKRCEYSNELMSFTLDSLMVKDIQNNHRVSTGVYISIALMIFLFGLFNNVNSFLTFIRPKPRKFGVGYYLLFVSIIDQCSLLILLSKIIHIILGTNGTLVSFESLNRHSCKSLSYLLSVFTRLTYWLTSFVTIERLCIALFPTSALLKNSRLALGASAFAVVIVSGMHIHEVLYYTIIDDLSYTSANITLCVANYVQPLVSTFNRVNVLLHYFIPFLIQMMSITIMIVKTAFSRARTNSSRHETVGDLFRKQLRTQKELYITPMIIVLSSLPQTILSFSYACTELKQSWQRYTLLTAYFLSYLPQMLGFLLYVLPSTSFSDEYRHTILGKRLVRQQKRTAQAKTKMAKKNIENVVSSKN